MPPDNPFLARIRARIEREPDRVFAEIWIGERRETLTWGDLGDRASSFAAAYAAQNVVAGDVVFLILRHGADLYPSYLGAMLIGAVPSFLPFPSAKQDPELYWSSHVAVFRRTGAKLLVTYDELVAPVHAAAGELAVLDVATIEHAPASPSTRLPDEMAVALLQHSSGTTGLKKGVALSFRAIRLQLEAYADRLRLDPQRSVIASWLPLYHDMGLIACFMLPLYLGIQIVSLDAFEWTLKPSLLLAAVAQHRATHVWLPNFAFAHIARATPKARRYDLAALEAVIGCSEPNKPAIFDAFAQRFAADGIDPPRLSACYAMAETVFAVSQTRPGEPPRRLGARIADGRVEIDAGIEGASYLSNGPPLSGVEVRVLRDGNLHGEGVAGEICVRAPFLFDGYFRDEAATSAAVAGGFFHTGDLGFLHEGEIYIFGRTKELIIVNGRNFFANDIEAAACEVAGVRKGRCVAFGLYLPAFGAEQIVVVAEHDGGASPDTVAAIGTALNARLATAPGDVRLVEPGWLVKTTSGKMSRAENIRKYVETFRPDADATSTPEQIA